MEENTVRDEQSKEIENTESSSTDSVLFVSEETTVKEEPEKKSKKSKKRSKKASDDSKDKKSRKKKASKETKTKDEVSDEHKILVISDTSEDVDLSSSTTLEEKQKEEERLEEERKEKERQEELKRQEEARLEAERKLKERLEEEKRKEEERIAEEKRKEEERIQEEKRKEEERIANERRKQEEARLEELRKQEELKKQQVDQPKDEDALDLSSVPSIVEKPKKKDRLSNTIQLKTSDDTLILQRELDHELLEKHFDDGLLERIMNPFEMVERIDFYNFEKLWTPISKLIIKWAIIILPIILFLANKLNAEAFSYARMLFTDKIWLWVRVVFLGVCAELLIYFGESLVGIFFGKGGHFKKILTAESYVSPSIIVPYLIAGLLLMFGFDKIGGILLIIAFVYSINLHTHVYSIVSGFPKNQSMIITSIFYGLMVALLVYFFKLSGEDMIQIMRVFFS